MSFDIANTHPYRQSAFIGDDAGWLTTGTPT
jgi:hypothetical protein